MILDTHIHLFEHGWGGGGPVDVDLTTYLALRQQYGIDQALVVGYEGEADGISYEGNNQYLLRLAADHEWIRPLCYLDRTALAADPGLPAHWLARGADGWSAYVIGAAEARAWAGLPDAAWSSLDADAAALSLNIDPDALAILLPRLRGLRRTTVFISHLGLPGLGTGSVAARLAAVADAVRSVARCRVKVSGLYALAGEGEQAPFPSATPYLQGLKEAVGVASLVWGSDFPPVLGHQDFASQVDLAPYGVFTANELEQVRSGSVAASR